MRPAAQRHQRVAAAEPVPPGFFGKLPMRGDFVARRVDARLRTVLDEWLSASLTASRRALGTDWAEAYHHAPSWRFVLTAGIAGADPVAGIMVPSADSYGRHFPLVVAVAVANCTTPLRLIRSAEPWYAAAELAALSGLAEGALLQAFDTRVETLGQPTFENDRATTAMRYPFEHDVEMAEGYAGLMASTLGPKHEATSAWWTGGGGGVAPSLLHHRGMPAPDRFAALLDGDWARWGWSDELAPRTRASADTASFRSPDGHDGPFRSAARTHRGTRSSSNQDAVLERPDLGLWAVADGAGGHDAGGYASSVVVAKLGEFQPALSFNSALTELEELLGGANDALRAKGRQLGPERLCAAVMVSLFVHEGRYAVIWAGDSRAYLHRDGRLQRLTRDHVSDGGRYVTRAIGAEPDLSVDAARGDAKPGDRFVLCSDGLVKTISDRMLAEAVRRGTAAEVAAELIDDALIAGASDNVTTLVVDLVA